MGRKVTIIGCGPGASDLITLRGKRALENADIIVGSKRLLEGFTKDSKARTILLEGNFKEMLEEIDRLEEGARIVFLVSGDPLFHSFGESIIQRFGMENCEVIPGISSYQYAFSLLKESWKAYKTFSLHGKNDLKLTEIFKNNDRFVLFLDPRHNLKYIKSQIKSINIRNCSFHVASNLTLPGENISSISFNDFDSFPEESLSLLIVRKDDE